MNVLYFEAADDGAEAASRANHRRQSALERSAAVGGGGVAKRAAEVAASVASKLQGRWSSQSIATGGAHSRKHLLFGRDPQPADVPLPDVFTRSSMYRSTLGITAEVDVLLGRSGLVTNGITLPNWSRTTLLLRRTASSTCSTVIVEPSFISLA